MDAMTEEVNSATALPILRARLNAARTRARAAAMLRGMVFSATAALLLLCGLELFALYSGAAASGLLAAPFAQPPSLLGLCLAVFAGGLALACVLALILVPDATTLARAAEHRFGLEERLSTALEVADDTQPHSARDPVRAALLADAERHAAAIDPRQVVRVQLPRSGWAIPVLVVGAVLLQLVPPDAVGLAALRGSSSIAARDDTGLSGQQAADVTANLRHIAELLGKDADGRSDQYLRSIARTLERLSLDVEGAAIDRRLLTGKLQSLVAHARQAYGEGSNVTQRAAPRDVVQQLQAALDDIAGNREAAAGSPRADVDEVRPDSSAAVPQERARRPAQPLERKTAGSQTMLVTAPQSQRAAGWDAALKDLDDYDLNDPRIERERAFAEQQRRARAEAQSAGAAKDAGAGEGDRAGEGTRPLGNGSTAVTELSPGAEMLLPDQTVGNGRRIRIELAPEAGLSKVAPPPLGNNGGAWQRGAEQTVEREALAPADRKVVGRYFTRSAGDHGP
jgi:hypothetical protein